MSLTRILYVEDDPFIQTVGRMALVDLGGFVLEGAGSGAEGLMKARSFDPDLILLDSVLPGMTGMEILRELRADPLTACIPVVFLTARVQPQEVSEHLRLGAVAVIPKPFDPTTLSDELRQIWSRLRRETSRRSA